MLQKLIFILLSPHGRIRRNQFWWAWVLILLLGLGLRQAQESAGGLLYLGAYCYLAVTIYGKRLHDIGKSAWTLKWPFGLHAAFLLVAVVGMQMIFNGSLPFGMFGILGFFAGLAPLILWTVFAFYVGLPEGQQGDNRFGADPLQELVAATAPGSGPAS